MLIDWTESDLGLLAITEPTPVDVGLTASEMALSLVLSIMTLSIGCGVLIYRLYRACFQT